MAVSVKHINADTTFLLSFTSPDDTLTPYQAVNASVNILVDPWIEGPSTIFHRILAYSKRMQPASVNHISEVKPSPDIILISQDKPDHCHEQTLKQLPPDLPDTIIIAQANAAKRIKSWGYFNESKISSFTTYDPDIKSTVFNLRLPFERDVRTVIQPGQLTLTFMAPKVDLPGMHNGIGITYRAPLFTNSEVSGIGLGVSLSPLPQHLSINTQMLGGRQPGPSLLPTPPDSPDDVERSFDYSAYSPRYPVSQPTFYNEASPSPPSTLYDVPPPPPIPESQECHGLRGRTASSSSMRSLYKRASRIITKSTPDLKNSKGHRGSHKRHQSSTEVPPPIPPISPIYQQGAPSTVNLDYSQGTASTGNSFRDRRWPNEASSLTLTKSTSNTLSPTMTDTTFDNPRPSPRPPRRLNFSPKKHTHKPNSLLLPNSPISISSPIPSPATNITGADPTISVLYSPHGLSYTTLLPWVQRHLVPLRALPLTLLLHPLTHITNPWFLGGNIATGWRGGLEIANKLMAKTWIAAHDEEKQDSGILVKTVKRGRDGNRQRVEAMLCNMDPGGDRVGREERYGPLIGKGRGVGGPNLRKRGTRVLELGVGATEVIVGETRVMC